jgi:branched-chain amino acid transport system permease protein
VGAALVTVLMYGTTGAQTAVIGRALVGLTLTAVILLLPGGILGFATRPRRARPAPPPAGSRPDGPAARGSAPAAGPPAPARAAGPPLLLCADVRKAFRGVQALAGVGLEVRQGEIVGLVGPNGSGKSTLINVVSGHDRPDGGRILVGGVDVAGRAAHRIAALGVSRTYQIPRPFDHLTVRDNVAVAGMFRSGGRDRRTAEREAGHWLEFTGLADRADALPAALNLHQRKFLELARALAAEPRLVLLDEVLSGLTPAEMADAVRLVRAIRDRGATVVFVEHIMRVVVDLADRVVVLASGQVIASGRPREVLRAPDVVQTYLGRARAHQAPHARG